MISMARGNGSAAFRFRPLWCYVADVTNKNTKIDSAILKKHYGTWYLGCMWTTKHFLPSVMPAATIWRYRHPSYSDSHSTLIGDTFSVQRVAWRVCKRYSMEWIVSVTQKATSKRILRSGPSDELFGRGTMGRVTMSSIGIRRWKPHPTPCPLKWT